MAPHLTAIPNVVVRNFRSASQIVVDRVYCPGAWAMMDISNTSCQGGYGADWTSKHLMMDDRSFGAIFCIGNTNGGTIG